VTFEEVAEEPEVVVADGMEGDGRPHRLLRRHRVMVVLLSWFGIISLMTALIPVVAGVGRRTTGSASDGVTDGLPGPPRDRRGLWSARFLDPLSSPLVEPGGTEA
jgi:hypothetical protein